MDRLKLAQGLRNLPASAREDLAGREQDIQRGKTVELLRRAGKEMYENPIVNTAVGLSPVLGDIQAGVEAYRSAQEGDWGNAGLNAVGMLPFIPMLGKTVWHGSPHSFEKFDLSKIGTGEGAQAYGHGLYLAESPEVAEGYRKTLSPNELIKQGEKIPYQQMDAITAGVANDIASKNGDIQAVRKMYEEMASQKFGGNIAKQRLAALDAMGNDVSVERGGNLYKVDLPDEQIAKMLDWDKPLTEQPEHIQEFVRNMDLTDAYGRNKGAIQAWKEGRDVGYIPKGQDVYNAMAGGKENDALASQMMYQQGIPGIQYLDQASRDPSQRFIARSPQGGESVFNSAQEAQDYIAQMAKHGHEFEYVDPNLTRNYVVFSDEIPQILERNNQPVGMFK